MLGLVLGACASPGQGTFVPVAAIETVNTLELSASEPGLARRLNLRLGIKPKDPVALQIVGLRDGGQPGDHALLELRLKWTDYVGTEPTSFGASVRRALLFGADGRATKQQPFERDYELVLDAPEERVLARRVEAWVRLHPVEVLTSEARTGGAVLEFPVVQLESFRLRPAGSLAAGLADPGLDAAQLFLLAASRPQVERLATLTQLVDALPVVQGVRREALFGALHYLTGETQGRSAYRWRTWLEARTRLAPEEAGDDA